MELSYSDSDISTALQTLVSIKETIERLLEWNEDIESAETYYLSSSGMQLLAANCTLLTAIGEGINRVNRAMPNFLDFTFPDVPWRAIIGMRNHIAHGYFELDADIIFDTISNDIPPLHLTIRDAIVYCEQISSQA